jgi:hypothetical protein
MPMPESHEFASAAGRDAFPPQYYPSIKFVT